MFNLRSVYFYFLAIKIYLYKNLKKIYFTTNYYNNSLKSKSPNQLYFYPNPFLLSLITNHNNFTFKISNIDADMFWKKQKSEKEEKMLHDFLWLNLINRSNEGLVIQNIITVWIHKNSKYKKIIWDTSVVSKRIISWILNANMILNNKDEIFKNNFFQSIVMQVNHLKNNIKFENDYSKKIEILTAILISSLVFKEYSNNYDFSLKELKKLIDDVFDENGFTKGRNSNQLLKFSKYLILIKECIKDSHKYSPEYLDETIDRNLNSLKSILTPKNELPLFNGSTLINIEEYFSYIERLNYKINKPKSNVGGIQIIKNKKNIVYFDVGETPYKNFSSNYQCGPLSLEYFFEGEKIITNCGFGSNISKKAMLLSRLTSAQSTLCLNNTSVTKFERSKLLNSAFGNSVTEGFKISNFRYEENDLDMRCEATHNAYDKKFGCKHKRSIQINKKSNTFYGTDEISKNSNDSLVNYDIRFHLYPGILATQTMGGKNILIQIKKTKSLIFTCKNEKLLVEKSIFLGGNKILNSYCITISGSMSGYEKKIYWEIKKTSKDAS